MPASHSPENTLCNYLLFFFVCALGGWLFEVGYCWLNTGDFVNRGLLHGPWLPIYGFGSLGVVLAFRRLNKHPLLVFLVSVLGCGLLEYFTGWYLETFKHLRWWNYSHEPFNLDGRVWIGSLISFGLCGLVIIYGFYPRLVKILDRLSLRPKKILCFALAIFFCADFIYSSDVPNTGKGITSEITYLTPFELPEPSALNFF